MQSVFLKLARKGQKYRGKNRKEISHSSGKIIPCGRWAVISQVAAPAGSPGKPEYSQALSLARSGEAEAHLGSYLPGRRNRPGKEVVRRKFAAKAQHISRSQCFQGAPHRQSRRTFPELIWPIVRAAGGSGGFPRPLCMTPSRAASRAVSMCRARAAPGKG